MRAYVCFLAVLLLVSVSHSADGVVQLGRPLKARDWLLELDSVPTAKVPYDSLDVARTIPRESQDYRINPEVKVAAYNYYFDVKGRDARYSVGSIVGLTKLVHELAVIEELKRKDLGGEFATGVVDGVKGIGTGIANLVTHPGQSFKNIGERLRQTGRSLERVVGAEEKVGTDETGTDRSHLGSGPAGQVRRELAYQFGVDVYTANPVLRKALVDLSHAHTAGSIATWIIPYNIGMLSYFNPISGDDATEQRIRDYDPYELRRLVGTELEPILRMDREDDGSPLNRWLMNPNYTPRNTAYIGQSLLQLRGAKNLGLVMRELSRADSPEEADMLTLELRLFGQLDKNVQRIADFEMYRSAFVGLGADGVMYIIFAGDTIRPWRETAEAFGDILAEAKKEYVQGMEIWTVGDIHPKMLEAAQRRGVVVHQDVLHERRLFPVQK